MGFEGVWIFAKLPVEAEGRAVKAIERALVPVLTPEVLAAVRAVEDDPELLVPELGTTSGDNEHTKFRWACTPVDNMVVFDKEAGCEGFTAVKLDRVAPVEMLFYTIGPKRFAVLPGRFGNMVIPAREVARVRRVVNELLEMDEDFQERGERILDLGNNDPEDVGKVLNALPDALEEIDGEDVGLVAYGTTP